MKKLVFLMVLMAAQLFGQATEGGGVPAAGGTLPQAALPWP
ncbi:MAG: hypothetical protein WA510_28040 [Acidobacteriaceae bacterium]